jgi:FMN reductase
MTASSDSHATSPGEIRPRRLVVISAGTNEPSSTQMLAGRITERSLEYMRQMDCTVSVQGIEVAPLAVEIAQATVSGLVPESLQATIEQVGQADAVIACTPVYKAGISGLFKSFIDLLDNDLLIAKPVLLAATAGSSRHALVIDEQMRPLFGYMRALTLPTSVFAATEDWGAPALGDRISRAATELAVAVHAGIEHGIAERAWSGYQHEFAGSATRAEQTAADIDFESSLMRLAAGGRAAGGGTGSEH